LVKALPPEEGIETLSSDQYLKSRVKVKALPPEEGIETVHPRMTNAKNARR